MGRSMFLRSRIFFLSRESFPLFQLVADEEIFHDGVHLFPRHFGIAVPPFLESEVAFLLGVHVCIEVVLLRP